MKNRMKMMLTSLLVFTTISCNHSFNSDELSINTSNKQEFIISNIHDEFDNNENEKIYQLSAPHDDRYIFYTTDNIHMEVYDQTYHLLQEDDQEVYVDLKKNDLIYLKVINHSTESSQYYISAQYLNNPVKLPYDVAFTHQEIDASYDDRDDLLKENTINYIKRAGGTYIYSNNPELFVDEDINQCIMENKHLQGSVYMAFEHANYSSKDRIYLGYKLINDGQEDVYVTIENVGFQAGGSWFGQKAWFDFYNTKFNLPEDYFFNGSISSKYNSFDYGYIDYTPRVYMPTTYKLPKGKSFYVIGGTNASSYQNIDIDGSSNKPLNKIQCSNGQVKFHISNGEVTGKMFIYDQEDHISDEMEEVGYVTLRNGKDYGRQYQGMAHHEGVIDAHFKWEFNDNTPSMSLPVTYTNSYAFDTSKKTPYAQYENMQHTKHTTTWITHLNPQDHHDAVGMDMVEFICNTTDKKEVIIDNNHADGSGEKANTANWMIEYQDHFTLVNKGNQKRKVILKLKDNGTLATLLKDQNGNVLQSYYSVGLANKTFKEYVIEIEPQSYVQVALDYLLVACSYGTVTHEVVLI